VDHMIRTLDAIIINVQNGASTEQGKVLVSDHIAKVKVGDPNVKHAIFTTECQKLPLAPLCHL